ncbi:MAG: histone deacetylase family protein [Hyphomicrobiaceae bacterium]
MTTLYITHEDCLGHDMGYGHPERPDRLRAVWKVLSDPMFEGLKREEAPLGRRSSLLLVHPEAYVAMIERAIPEDDERVVPLDGDTSVCRGSLTAALRAVGAAERAVDAVMTGEVRNAFCATRPPGHHAESARAMGFCLFSNAAIAAHHARRHHGAERVAVVDFDVHHGNGTQEIFWSDKDLFYGSTHQMPLYPGSGALSETGVGNIFNAPLRSGDGGEQFRAAVESRILPALHDFGPDLVIISAGFDAHRDDPLGGLELVEADFAWVTDALAQVAERHCRGRVVSLLEGGYDLRGLARSTAVHVGMLMAAGGEAEGRVPGEG